MSLNFHFSPKRNVLFCFASISINLFSFQLKALLQFFHKYFASLYLFLLWQCLHNISLKGHNNVVSGSFTVRIPGYYSCSLSAFSTTQLNIITRAHSHIRGVCAAKVGLPAPQFSQASCTAIVRLNAGDEVFVVAQQSGHAFAPWVPQRSDAKHFEIPYVTFHCHIIEASPTLRREPNVSHVSFFSFPPSQNT